MRRPRAPAARRGPWHRWCGRGPALAAAPGRRPARQGRCPRARPPLHIDQLLDQLVQLVAAEVELAPQGAHGETALLLEDLAGALELRDEAHPAIASISPASWGTPQAAHARASAA